MMNCKFHSSFVFDQINSPSIYGIVLVVSIWNYISIFNTNKQHR